jgi:hypothetical protein
MTHCHRCDVDVDLVSTLTDRGVMLACPKCEAPHGRPGADGASVPTAAPSRRAAAIAPSAPSVRLTSGDDVVEAVRARLAAIDVELERADGLRRERRTLAAMLRAAEKKR